MSESPVAGTSSMGVVDAITKLSGASVATVLLAILGYLLVYTVPAIQKDSADQRRAYEQTSAETRATFERAIEKIDQRTAQRDAKIVDALLELKRDNNK